MAVTTPPPAPSLSPQQIAALRAEHYNARVVSLRRVHGELMVLRVQPTAGRVEFEPGQYTVLGLGNWEPHELAPGEPAEAAAPPKLIQRAYSFSSPLVDEHGRLVRASSGDVAEFYVALVPGSAEHVAGLTPRLFALDVGSALFLGPRPHGHYSLAPVAPGDAVLFAATGTGEAPHNTMLAELLARGHTGPIVSLVCVRRRADLAYEATHRALERQFANYRYVTLTTREPENLDPQVPGFVGKQYVQDYIASGQLTRDTGFPLDPQRTHVFLCGNPEMIGLPRTTPEGGRTYPAPRGLIEVLENRGFNADQPHTPGNVHFEKYW